MPFFIVLIGALLFGFYQFQPSTPVCFNRVEWQRLAQGANAAKFQAIEEKHAQLHTVAQQKVILWRALETSGNTQLVPNAKADMIAAQKAVDAVRKEAKDALIAADPKAKIKDSDYVFITFILSQLPH